MAVLRLGYWGTIMDSHILMLIGFHGHVNARNYRIQPVTIGCVRAVSRHPRFLSRRKGLTRLAQVCRRRVRWRCNGSVAIGRRVCSCWWDQPGDRPVRRSTRRLRASAFPGGMAACHDVSAAFRSSPGGGFAPARRGAPAVVRLGERWMVRPSRGMAVLADAPLQRFPRRAGC